MDHCVTSEITCRINIPYQLLQHLLFNIPPAVWLCLFKPQNLEITQTSFVFQKICAETQTCAIFLRKAKANGLVTFEKDYFS